MTRNSGVGAVIFSVLQTDRTDVWGPNNVLLEQHDLPVRSTTQEQADILSSTTDVKNMRDCTLNSQYIFTNLYLTKHKYIIIWGHAVAQLVEALRYKSEGRGFDSQWCHWNFSLT